ncbi:MAG: fucose isomerase, partial [Planctomycetes bacterium]|nr:fucose isomerase [Planctomycetota bacterium]
MPARQKTTFAVIVGNRGFFPDHLAKSGRRDMLDVLKKNGYGSIAIATTQVKNGAVESFDDAKKCAEL